MWNSFYGLEMGRRAMDYFRRGMETAGHNISNADVEGFSRQRVEPSTTDPFTNPALNRPALPGQVGTGVKVDAIVRLRDAFLDIQYREEMTVKGYWEQIDRALRTLEVYINEPAGQGFKATLDEYWASLQELHKRPDSSAVREDLVEKTKNLTVYLDQFILNYDDYRAATNREIKLMVEEANSIIDQIAALNVTIAQVQGVGGNPNDLMDKRDLLAEKLSKFMDITVNPPCLEGDGEYKIDLGGKLLVQGDKTRYLVLVDVPGNGGFFDVQVEDNLFDAVSNPEVLFAVVEQGAPEATHYVDVHRLASGTAWSVGQGDALCPDRLKPETITESLNIAGSFSIQVGAQGTRAASSVFDATPPGPGVVLEAGAAGDQYAFRVSAGTFEETITVTWNDVTSRWDFSLDGGDTVSASSAGQELLLSEIAAFVDAPGNVVSSVNAAGTQMTLSSPDNYLLSIVDVKGDLASTLGIANEAPVVLIEVTEEDSLETIRNKINSMYSSANGLARPEDWLHASIELDADGTYYLLLESNIAGEAHRINVMGDDKGSLQIAKRLGFLGDNNSSSYKSVSQDAAFTFDGKLYLSESNTLRNARRVPVKGDYSASTLEEVSEGIRLELRTEGQSSITVRHHIKNGAIRGALEARDDLILGFLDIFDEIAYTLANEMNALHYAGHGMGDNAMTTGTAFFTPITSLYGASRNLSINRAIEEDRSLIAAASGNGHGYSSGEGDGSNALRMAQLKQTKVLESRSADFNSFYEAFIAKLGSQGQRAGTMLKNQNALVNQINNQRQSVMGVNIDEEMMDIIRFQQAFNAIARYITTIDEMLDRIINGMGIVGR